MPEFLVALNLSFTSLIEEGVVVRQVSCTLLMVGVLLIIIIIIIIIIINNNNNISKASFPNGPKAIFTRLKIQIFNNTIKSEKKNPNIDRK